MKVELFHNTNGETFEDDINEFLEKRKEDVRITEMQYSMSYDSDDREYVFSALITYEEIER